LYRRGFIENQLRFETSPFREITPDGRDVSLSVLWSGPLDVDRNIKGVSGIAME
jgi:hypothetical protein